MKFYTSFYQKGNKLNVRGYENGKKFFERHDINPSLYIINNSSNESNTTDISFYGEPLRRVDFTSPWEAKDFIKNNQDMKIYGYPNFDYAKVNELFGSDFDTSLLSICYIDIETKVGDDCDEDRKHNYDSFPSIEDPHHEISLITFLLDGVVNVFTTNDSFNEQEVISIVYAKCPQAKDLPITFNFQSFRDERIMLATFVLTMEQQKPDIITGWNTDGFDIPYICQRIAKIIGEDTVKRLSPFEEVTSRQINSKFGSKELRFEIKGIQCLDYLELYRKFELSPRENYKLETITQLELGTGKLEYSGSFKSFYQNDWPTFIAYNIIDVLLIYILDDKLGFIDVAASMAHASKCTYTDVFRVTRIWDNIIANYCVDAGIQVPTNFSNKRAAYEGAFVKPTIPGLYKWIASFDIASLYPSIIMQQNISPETILPEHEFLPMTAQDMINQTDVYHEALQNAKENNATLNANGALFSREKEGIIPTLIGIYMKERKAAKKEMFVWANKLEYAKARLTK